MQNLRKNSNKIIKVSVPYIGLKEYKTSFLSSVKEPTHSQELPLLGNAKVISSFPNIFCTVPTSPASEVETCIFNASLYCPDGINLSSRSLFKDPLEK